MNKRTFFSLIIVSFFLFTINVKADYSYIVVNTSLYVRTGPSTKYEIKANLKSGSSYRLMSDEIVPDEKKDGTCDAGWYNINYEENSYYVCSEYATKYIVTETTPEEDIEAKTECHLKMKNAGFPATYWTDLCMLQTAHPTWQFKALNTNLDFKTSVEKESSCGKSYIATSNSEYIDTSCKNAYTKTWYPASQKAVAYYMDPRNWLDEKHVFQFLFLQYENSMSNLYAKSVTNVIQNTQFYKYHLNNSTDLSKIVDQAGKDTNVSPVFLATRMYQELGTGDSLKNLYQGNYTGHDGIYKGYYNFFDFGVTDECVKQNGTTYCGLNYAKNKGWNSPLAAISGASKSLSSSYISVGQYTTYLQKFNVVPTKESSIYLHQYMTNIAGPSAEGVTTYNTYNKMNLLGTSFVFYIPIYNNMNNVITNTNQGANGEDGTTTITKYDISTIIKLSGYHYDGSVIDKIDPGTKAQDIKGDIEAISGTTTIITDHKGNVLKDDDLIGTGSIVKINNGIVEESIAILVKGDTSGDGKINALDLLQVQKDILGSYTLSGVFSKAADTSGDGKINALDLLQIQKDIIGVSKVKQ